MKLRHPFLIKAAGWLGARVLRALLGSLRYHYRPLGIDIAPARLGGSAERFIGIFWHENMLLPAYHYGRPDVRVLISQHADGQLVAEICRHLGFGVVRGSTTRGGAEAVRAMLHAGPDAYLAITPDGPRGPRRRVQPGVVYLAARTGLPILVVGVGYAQPWRMASWDQFALPRPFSRAACVSGQLIRVPTGTEREELEHYRQLVERELEHVTRLAESWAESGTWPVELEQATRANGAKDAAA